MGKNRNRNRNKNRAKKAKGGTRGDDGETSKTPATNSNADKTSGGETKTLVDEQKDVKKPEETGANDAQEAVLRGVATGNSKAKRDSVISTTSEGPTDTVNVPAQVAPRPGWKFRIRRWLWRSWPCRLVRWIHRFLVALVRINWNNQRRVADLLLTVGLAGSAVFGVYLVVDFLVEHWGELMAVFPAKWLLARHDWLRGYLDQAISGLKDIWGSLGKSTGTGSIVRYTSQGVGGASSLLESGAR